MKYNRNLSTTPSGHFRRNVNTSFCPQKKLIRIRNGHYRRIIVYPNAQEERHTRFLIKKSTSEHLEEDLLTHRFFPLDKDGNVDTKKSSKKISKLLTAKSRALTKRKFTSKSIGVMDKDLDDDDDDEPHAIESASSSTSFSIEMITKPDSKMKFPQKSTIGQQDAAEENNEDTLESPEEENDNETLKEEETNEEIDDKENRKNSKDLIDPSLNLMKGISVSIYFINTNTVVDSLMCFNYKCNVIIFQKECYLRYLYLKTITYIIISNREINELCDQRNVKHMASTKAVGIVSNDFKLPLVIEFKKPEHKKEFIVQIKAIINKELNRSNYNNLLEELDNEEKLRLKKVERFHNYALIDENI